MENARRIPECDRQLIMAVGIGGGLSVLSYDKDNHEPDFDVSKIEQQSYPSTAVSPGIYKAKYFYRSFEKNGEYDKDGEWIDFDLLEMIAPSESFN